MNVEETIKHLGNHWDLYRFVGNEERNFDAAKRFLMEHCEKPESTARAKMNSFRYTKDSLIKISSDGKRYSIDPEKVNELEALIDSVIHFSDFDYRCDQMKEWADIYRTQSKYTEEWMDRYFDLKELNEKQQMRLFSEKQELRNKSGETMAGISEKVDGLLIIDDLGAERSTEYAVENVFNVIDRRYRTGKPLIITTNLHIDTMRNETSIDKKRIYDRVFEMCAPVQMKGVSKRKLSADNKIKLLRELNNRED